MALFQGEEMVTIDVGGRTQSVPASVAMSLGLTPVNNTPPPMPQAPMPQTIGPGQAPQNETRAEAVGQHIPAQSPGMPVNWSPLGAIDKGVAQAADPSLGARIDALAPAEQGLEHEGAGARAPKPAAPQGAGRKVGPREAGAPALGGYGEGWQTIDKANQDQQVALQQTADTQAVGELAMAGALQTRNQKIDKLFDERAQTAAANLMKLEKRNADYDASVKKYADAKIDRDVDHPVLAGVSAVLGAIGMAMMGKGAEENPAIKALYTAIDRKVAGQMQDLEKKGKVLGYQKDSIERMRSMAQDDLAFKNLLISGETERAARQMEEIGARTNSEVIRAKAKEGAMGLRARAADLKMAAIDKQNDADQKLADRKQRDTENKRSVGAQNYATATSYKMHKEKLEFDKEKNDNDMAKAILAADKAGDKERAKHLQDQAKENNQRGVGDANGNYLLQPEGKKLFEQAKKFEDDAAKLEAKNPAAAAQMRAKAAQIRQDVLADEEKGVWRMGDPNATSKMAGTIAETSAAVKLMQEIKQLSVGKDKSWFSTDQGQAAIQSKATALAMRLKNAWGLGVLSKQDTALITQGTGGDPTRMDEAQLAHALTAGLVGNDPENFVTRLDALTSDLKGGILKTARRNKYRGDAKDFFDEEETAAKDGPAAASYRALTGGKTIDQQIDGAGRDAYRDAEQGKSFNNDNGLVENTKDTGRAMKGVVQKAFFGGTEQDRINRSGEFEGSFFSKDQAAAADDLIARAKAKDPEAVKLLNEAMKDPEVGGAIRGRMERGGMLEEKAASLDSVDVLARKATVDKGSFDMLSRLAAQGDQTAQAYLQGVIEFKSRRDNRPLADRPVWDRRPAKIE